MVGAVATGDRAHGLAATVARDLFADLDTGVGAAVSPGAAVVSLT